MAPPAVSVVESPGQIEGLAAFAVTDNPVPVVTFNVSVNRAEHIPGGVLVTV